MGRTTTHHRARLAVGLAFLLAVALPPAAAAAPSTEEPVLVLLRDGSSADAVADRADVDPSTTFDSAIDGFSASVTPTEAARLRRDARVRQIIPNRRVQVLPAAEPAAPDLVGTLGTQLTALLTSTLRQLGLTNAGQTTPTAISRVGAPQSSTARIDGRDDRVDATIAVLDTGVAAHPDLNLVGGVDCTEEGAGWDVDGYGHGTLVAGTAAALDNAVDVVGVAPGARILSAKALDAGGGATPESLLCAVEWVLESGHEVDALNISLGWRNLFPNEGAPCGMDLDAMREALCAAIERGITVAVAAGNETADASTLYPAAYDEVITVSALVDFDGRPGGRASAPSCGGSERDDHLRSNSNVGPSVDVAAVGLCVLTTSPLGGVTMASGTSLAAPAVAGAVALLRGRAGPSLTPAEIRSAILAAVEPGPIPGDRDAFPEGILRVSGF